MAYVTIIIICSVFTHFILPRYEEKMLNQGLLSQQRATHFPDYHPMQAGKCCNWEAGAKRAQPAGKPGVRRGVEASRRQQERMRSCQLSEGGLKD